MVWLPPTWLSARAKKAPYQTVNPPQYTSNQIRYDRKRTNKRSHILLKRKIFADSDASTTSPFLIE